MINWPLKKCKLALFSLAGMSIIAPIAAAETISIDVFAIPSKPIVELVKQTSDQLKKQGMESFYAKGMPVHATLYLTQFPAGSEETIKQRVAQIAQHYQPIEITADGVTVTASNWAFINLQWSQALQQLADNVTMAIEPLRAPNPALPDWVKHYPNKLQAFKRYGSPNVFQNFEPHLTLLAAESNPKLAEFKRQMDANPPQASGEIIGIGIGIADQWGQQKQVLARYMFK